MKKIFLGFAGEMASGKGTATELIKQWYPGTPSFRFSDSLRDCYGSLLNELAPIGALHRHLLAVAFPCDDEAVRLTIRVVAARAFGLPLHARDVDAPHAAFATWVIDEFIPAHAGVWSATASTPDLQAISTAVRRIFGENILERALMARAEGVVSPSPFIVIEGIRRLVDIGSLMHNPDVVFRLTYVFAHTGIRHERHRLRNEKPGDDKLSLEQFIELGKAEAEREIRLLEGHAHAVIDNGGSPEAFETAVSATLSDWLMEINGA